jgi:hypothetical protein
MGKQRKYGGRAVQTPLRKKATRRTTKRTTKPATSKVYSDKPVYRVDPMHIDHDVTLKTPQSVHALRG